MVENFTESLAHNLWILWLMMATLAVAGESIERTGWLGRVAIGFGAAGVTALIWPAGWWLQWIVGIVALALAFIIRRRRLASGATAVERPATDDEGARD